MYCLELPRLADMMITICQCGPDDQPPLRPHTELCQINDHESLAFLQTFQNFPRLKKFILRYEGLFGGETDWGNHLHDVLERMPQLEVLSLEGEHVNLISCKLCRSGEDRHNLPKVNSVVLCGQYVDDGVLMGLMSVFGPNSTLRSLKNVDVRCNFWNDEPGDREPITSDMKSFMREHGILFRQLDS